MNTRFWHYWPLFKIFFLNSHLRINENPSAHAQIITFHSHAESIEISAMGLYSIFSYTYIALIGPWLSLKLVFFFSFVKHFCDFIVFLSPWSIMVLTLRALAWREEPQKQQDCKYSDTSQALRRLRRIKAARQSQTVPLKPRVMLSQARGWWDSQIMSCYVLCIVDRRSPGGCL